MRVIFLLFLFVAASLQVGADEALTDKSPPPTDPVLNRTPEYSAWTVNFQSPSPNATVSSDLVDGASSKLVPTQLISVIKTKGIIAETTTDIQGGHVQKWVIGGLIAVTLDGGKTFNLTRNLKGSGDDIALTSYQDSDFAGLGWVNSSKYGGISNVQEKKCWLFRGEVYSLPPRVIEELRTIYQTKVASNGPTAFQSPHYKVDEKQNPKEYLVPAEAYIDITTHLPLLYKIGKETREYHYLTPPSEQLVLPPILAKQLKLMGM